MGDFWSLFSEELIRMARMKKAKCMKSERWRGHGRKVDIESTGNDA